MTDKRTNHHCDRKNFRKGKSAVSEIIGNLLILAITVTLFSSVLYFVINMPTPQDQMISDFGAQTGVSGTSLYINVTHKGGQTLTDSSTNIILYENGVPTVLGISSSSPSLGSEWNIGEVWSYIMAGYSSTMAVNMIIVDKSTNSIVWETSLADNSANQNVAPIIGNRGLTPFPVHDQDNVSFFVVVTVLDSSVNSVNVDASSLGLSGNIPLYDTDQDGTFTSTDSYTASYGNWTGQTIIFSVNDMAGNHVMDQFIVDVSQSPSVVLASG